MQSLCGPVDNNSDTCMCSYMCCRDQHVKTFSPLWDEQRISLLSYYWGLNKTSSRCRMLWPTWRSIPRSWIQGQGCYLCIICLLEVIGKSDYTTGSLSSLIKEKGESRPSESYFLTFTFSPSWRMRCSKPQHCSTLSHSIVLLTSSLNPVIRQNWLHLWRGSFFLFPTGVMTSKTHSQLFLTFTKPSCSVHARV